MGTIPSRPTFTAGQVLTASQLESFGAVVDFWADPPRCYAYRDAGQSLSDSTWEVLNLGVEAWDVVQSGDTEMHSLSERTRVYCRTAGTYNVTFGVRFTADGTGNRQASLGLNTGGTHDIAAALMETKANPNSAISAYCLGTVDAALTVGDYLEIFAYQSSGGSLSTLADTPSDAFLSVRLVAE